MKPQDPPISVLLDARKLGDGGIGAYIENLVNGLLTLPERQRKKFCLALLTPPLDHAKISEERREYLAQTIANWGGEVTVFPEPAEKYSLEEYLLLASRHREQLHVTDVFHSPHYTLPYFLKIPTIVTIHDIIHVTHPDSKLHAIVGRKLIASALKRANHVIAVSKETRDQLQEHFGPAQTPVTVIPNGLQNGICRQPEDEVANFCASNYFIRPYCLFVGSDRQHKGFQMLCQAWRLLQNYCQHEQRQMPVLIAVGNRYSAHTKALVYEAGLGHVIRFVDHVPTATLALLYSGAEALLLPSRQEGFGLMALEAMACRTRVVATPLASVKEICGRSGYYSEDFTAETFFAALRRCLEDKRWERKAIDGLCRAKKFSLTDVADKTLKLYLKVVKDQREGIDPPLLSQLERSLLARNGDRETTRPQNLADSEDVVLEVFDRK